MIGGLDGIRAKSESMLPRKTILARTPIANPDHLFPAVVVALTTAKNRPPPSYSPQRTSSLALRVGIRQINFTASTASATSFELMKIKRLPAITYVARCHAPGSYLHLCPMHLCPTGKRPENTNPKRQQGTPPSEVLAPTQAARYRVGICRIKFSTPTPSANSYGFADAVEKNAMIARLQ